MEKPRHTLDILFPLGVLAAFAAAAITVLLMTAGVYRGNVEQSAAGFGGPTALNYITEKLHQNDSAGAVRVSSIEGADALVITEEYLDVFYDTYIYCYDGSLRELMVRREVEPAAAMGRALLPLASFKAEQRENGLLYLNCTDESGVQREAYVSLRSGEDEAWN